MPTSTEISTFLHITKKRAQWSSSQESSYRQVRSTVRKNTGPGNGKKGSGAPGVAVSEDTLLAAGSSLPLFPCVPYFPGQQSVTAGNTRSLLCIMQYCIVIFWRYVTTF